MPTRRIHQWFAHILLSMVAAATPALAQEEAYPKGPIRLVVPFSPGGGTDIVARTLAQHMSTALKESVIVENRPGANGIVGTLQALRAKPDGYTLLLAIEATVAMNPSLYKAATYRTDEFAPISMVSRQPYVIAAHPSLQVKSLGELVALVKKAPGKLNYASGASAAYLAAEMFKMNAGLDIPNVPYKGSGEAIADVLAGRVPVIIASPVSLMGPIKNGQLKAVAVTSAQRAAILPDVPTIAEQGYADFDVVGWYGISAPKGTPPQIIEKLNSAITAALQSKALQDRFAGAGVTPAGSTAAAFGTYMVSETERWAKLIQRVGIASQ